MIVPSNKRVQKQQICLECQRLGAENEKLRQEIDRLKHMMLPTSTDKQQNESKDYSDQTTISTDQGFYLQDSTSVFITKDSTLSQKIDLFRLLFKGRDDVYARRFESNKSNKTGYAPVCRNDWKTGVCLKPKVKCQDCHYKDYLAIKDQVIEDHFRGKTVVGLYPLLSDDNCWLLAIDFDEGDWQADIRTLRQFCDEHRISIAVERSRSGNGGHAWFFFSEPLPAVKARRFGSVLITAIMHRRHEVSFKSYDRLFPSQDSLAKDGLGNLIALPLQGQAAQAENSCFVDAEFNRYKDQWAFLSQVHRLSEAEIDQWISALSEKSDLGELNVSGDDTVRKPWQRNIEKDLDVSDFPTTLTITLANGIYVPKQGLSQKALNRIKRLAAFSNPEFFKKQAMHFSTWDTPRIIACHQEHEQYIQLPRGCQDALEQILIESNVNWQIQDDRQSGHPIQVSFKGSLWPLQQEAADIFKKRQMGVLCGTTAFGKTVTAINLIAHYQTNTLILVDSVPLMQQWQDSIKQFLEIQEQLPEEVKSRGRKKQRNIVGQLGGSRKETHGVIDIAVFQSVITEHQVKDIVKDYGMVIVDECHHVAAASFQQVMDEVNAKYIYGLSATPVRQDGKHPIVFMQCGPILYRDDAKKQADERSFAHILSPRFTNYQLPPEWDIGQSQIQDIFTDLTISGNRNRQIIQDILTALRNERSIMVLTDRKDHVELLVKEIKPSFPEVITLTGMGTTKQKREKLEVIKSYPTNKPMLIVATGKYVGEGFDVPRLDTLFLVMPFSWNGTLAQYAGRLHRIYSGKSDVQIYDYVDIHVPVLERMYGKRLKGYRDLGYQLGELGLAPARLNFIFDQSNYWDDLMNDLLDAKEMIWISSTSLNIRPIKLLEKTIARRSLDIENQVLFIKKKNQDSMDIKRDYEQKANEILNRLSFDIRPVTELSFNAVIIDQRILWYGSLAPLGFPKDIDSIMRIESPRLAMDMQSVLSDKTVL